MAASLAHSALQHHLFARVPDVQLKKSSSPFVLRAAGQSKEAPQPRASKPATQKQQPVGGQHARPAAPGGQASPPKHAAHASKSSPPAIPEQVLGVDYGTKWTGLALGNKGVCKELQVLPSERSDRGMFARQIVDMAVRHQASGILVGMPLDPFNPKSTLSNPDADSEHGRRCRWFAHSVAMVARPRGISVYLYDESETSSDALSVIGMHGRAKQEGLNSTRKRLEKKVDSLSAFLLLKKFYDAPGRAMRIVMRGAQ